MISKFVLRAIALPGFIMGAAMLMAPCDAVAQTVIRLAHTLNPADARHLAAERFGKLIAERSGGALRVEVYPSSQLGGQSEIFEGMKLGLIQMNIAGSTHLSNLLPAFGVFDLPGLASSEEAYMTMLDGKLGQRLLDMLPQVGLRGLAYSEVGFRHIYTNRPVRSIKDLSGMIIRVPGNAIYNDTISTFGARPTPMALGEVFTALQQGAIGGAENLISFYRNSGHWEVARYLSLTYHAALPSVVIISDVFWKGLNPKMQEVVRTSAREAALYERELSARLTKSAMAELPKLGVTIIELDLAPFQALAPKIQARHEKRIGAELMAAVRAGGN